jgi:hypothetical protein
MGYTRSLTIREPELALVAASRRARDHPVELDQDREGVLGDPVAPELLRDSLHVL